MSGPGILFVLIAAALIGLLLVASRPPRVRFRTPQEAFEMISQPRHFTRLPQIDRALKSQDVEYLRQKGYVEAARRLQAARQKLALDYVNKLQEEFEILLDASRFLAASAPAVVPTHEVDRWRMSLTFAVNSNYLRTKLWLGMQPAGEIGKLSGLSAIVSRQVEAAVQLTLENLTINGNSTVNCSNESAHRG